MEKTKQKSKKDKPSKHVDKEKSPSFITDVKTFKESLKIREILRTVKMNSSMRIKAPSGSKVMENKDFIDSNDYFEDTISFEGQNEDPTSATNRIINNEYVTNIASEEHYINNDVNTNTDAIQTELSENVEANVDTPVIHESKSLCDELDDCSLDDTDTDTSTPTNKPLLTPENIPIRSRDRKLSLDHTMLSRTEGLSQSEVDLHSIGKSPLERKSSFFKKKMDSFLKNTTEIFKRQSLSSKSSVQRRGSTCSRMSVSLQSLNENAVFDGHCDDELMQKYQDQLQGSATSLHSTASQARSNSSISINVTSPPEHSEESLISCHQGLIGSQPLPGISSSSINNLNEGYIPDSLMNTRAISMSSGLDNANGHRRRKTSRSNRVSWLASESLTDYFRRLIQDEKSQEMQEFHSYQDFSTIPEISNYGPKTDSKGRRLSYQRAVSGEDPVLSSKYQDTSLKRRKIPEVENQAGPPDIATCLANFSENGIPPLYGYTILAIDEEATGFLTMFGTEGEHEKHFEWFTDLPPGEEAKLAVIKELVYTEAHHIFHLKTIAEVYIAAAHALQDLNLLLELNTSKLFLNIPDVLNANMAFWEVTIYPMLKEATDQKTTFDTSLMIPGFEAFSEIFEPYEEYVQNQTRAVDYLRRMNNCPDFVLYLNWCNQNTNNRLQLADMLVKPMQRLTKYSLLINRLVGYINQDDKKKELEAVDRLIKAFTQRVNRGVRQKEEIALVAACHIDTFDLDFKDEEMDKLFKQLNKLNLGHPMLECDPGVMRCLVHHGDLRFKDHLKEFDSHIFLFTDMILVCKKYNKGNYQYKMQRAKYLLNWAVPYTRASKGAHDHVGLIYIMVDLHNAAQLGFALSEVSKDPNPAQTMRTWDLKLQEAMMAYVLTKWYTKYPVKDFSIIEAEYNTEEYKKSNPDAYLVERRARERVAAMMHPGRRVRETPQEPEPQPPPSDYDRARGPHNLHDIFLTGNKHFNAVKLRLSSFHQSTTSHSSQNMSTSDLQFSMSGGSHEELPLSLAHLFRSASSVEGPAPPGDEVQPSITVHVVDVNDTEMPSTSGQAPAVPMVLDSTSSRNSPTPRSLSVEGSQNTLQVSPSHTAVMVHSMPNINAAMLPDEAIDPHLTASERLYRVHYNILARNRLTVYQQQYLTPDHRGLSYPPPSPSRASLQRGFAFSYSFKNPPLKRSKNVHSLSQVQLDVPTLADRILGRKSPQPQGELQSSTSAAGHLPHSPATSRMSPSSSRGDLNMPSASQDTDQPGTSQVAQSKSEEKSPKTLTASEADNSMPSTSRGTTAEKRQKKRSLINRSRNVQTPEPQRENQTDDLDTIDYDADDDGSRRSSKSEKCEKSTKGKQRMDKTDKSAKGKNKKDKLNKKDKPDNDSDKSTKEDKPDKPDRKDKKDKGKG